MAGHRDFVFTVKGHHDITIPIRVSEDMPLAKGDVIQRFGKEISKVISKRIAIYNKDKADDEKIVLDEATQSEAERLYTYKGNSKNASIDKVIDVPNIQKEKKLSNENVMGM